MASERVEGEEQEALFNASTCAALYYVRSPSTASHANSTHSNRNPSNSPESALLSPFPQENFNANCVSQEAASRFALSRYSSSRGSNNSFPHEKKTQYDVQSHDVAILKSGRLRIVNRVGDDIDDDGEVVVGLKRYGLWRFVALDPSSSCCCIAVQIVWRLLVSIGVALLVFFLLTRPPSPKISFKVVGFKEFSLGEGLDNTGVVTKILSSNCSINMEIDNDSKVFGLHVHPPTVEMAFGRLVLARSQGPQSYVKSDNIFVERLYIAVKDRPVYGAGRSMQDMLESGQGLPLLIRVRSSSNYRVVWSMIKLRYIHHEECLLVLDRAQDRKHHVHIHNSTCSSSTINHV